MNIIIKEYSPTHFLRPYVDSFWVGDFNTLSNGLLTQSVVPSGHIELIIHLSDLHCDLQQAKNTAASPAYTLIGLYTQLYEVHFKSRVHVFGIRFKPEGLFPIFAVPAAEILSRFADVEMLVKRDFGDFCHRIKDAHSTGERISLAESFLLKKIGNKLGTPHYLHFASEIIRQRNGQISLQELAGEVFISPRQLEREFKQKIGISPKQYMRIARLNSVQKMINETTSKQDFSGISYDAGYADQAHFIRDFKYFTGKSPRRFIENRKHFIVNIQ